MPNLLDGDPSLDRQCRARRGCAPAAQAAAVARVAAHELGAAAYAIKAARALLLKVKARTPGGSSADGSVNSSPMRSANRSWTISDCETTSADRCSTADTPECMSRAFKGQ